MYGNKLKVIRLGQKGYLEIIEDAMRINKTGVQCLCIM